MATLEYQERDRAILPRRLMRWIAYLFIIGAIVAAGWSGIVVYRIGSNLRAARQAVEQFYDNTSGAKMRGKTAEQIVALLGKPDSDTSYGDGSRWLVYRGPWDSMCGITITKDGVASDVEHWAK
jgi:hypothetical protein